MSITEKAFVVENDAMSLMEQIRDANTAAIREAKVATKMAY